MRLVPGPGPGAATCLIWLRIDGNPLPINSAFGLHLGLLPSFPLAYLGRCIVVWVPMYVHNMLTEQNFHIWPARGATNIIRFLFAFFAIFNRVPWVPLLSPGPAASRLSSYMFPEYAHNIGTLSDTFPLSWELFRISGYFSKSGGLGIASYWLGIVLSISPM